MKVTVNESYYGVRVTEGMEGTPVNFTAPTVVHGACRCRPRFTTWDAWIGRITVNRVLLRCIKLATFCYVQWDERIPNFRGPV